MHKTEGANHSNNLFVNGPPGTTLEKNWLNAMQNEVVNVIEGAGITLKTATTETGDQLLAALEILYGKAAVMQKYTTNDTWTKPTGLRFIIVEVIGGGGGGGGVTDDGAGDFAAGAGGAGGGYSCKLILASALAATETVTIGAKGTGGSVGNGNSGGTTSFGAHLQATGGTGGAGDVADAALDLTSTGAPGVGSGGDVNAEGGQAHSGLSLSVTVGVGGHGGASILGGGGLGSTANAVGGDAVTPGSGGAGAHVQTAAGNFDGGDGADGLVTVYEFF
jgi:hypothetical protein